MNDDELLQYARGYYDGRTCAEGLEDHEASSAYLRGRAVGVKDHCELDLQEDPYWMPESA